ncbi:MAG: hypothetical protein ACOCRK_07890 [bacterium]
MKTLNDIIEYSIAPEELYVKIDNLLFSIKEIKEGSDFNKTEDGLQLYGEIVLIPDFDNCKKISLEK